MRQAVDFLNSLAQALSAMRLYGEKHAARQRATGKAYDAVVDLLQAQQPSTFSFLDEEVIFANEPLREMKTWKWARPLARVGVERLEVQAGVRRDEFEGFLARLRNRLDHGPEVALDGGGSFPHINFGQISLQSEGGKGGWARRATVDLREETDAAGWLMGEAEKKGKVSAAVSDAVVRSLSIALREEQNVFQLLLPLRDSDEYTTVHSMNVSILSMAIAEAFGHSGSMVKAVGEAALLHDVGKTRTPRAVLQKPGELSPEEWAVVQQHPAEGARILVNSSGELELAAIVAYEHHVTWNGGGYPKLRRGRRPHPVSQLVQMCDIYDALRTQRPFRGAWEPGKVLEYLKAGAGNTYDPDVVAKFLDLVAKWDSVDGREDASGEQPLPAL